MKNIKTLIPDIYTALETKKYTGDLEGIAKEVGQEVTDALVTAFSQRDKKPHLRMSGIGRCERSQWYNMHGYEEEQIPGNVHLTFLQGHVMEAIILGVAQLAGHKVEGKQKHHTLEGINGSQDCEIDGELVDVKTASSWSYDNKFGPEGIKGDTFGYVKQLSAYGKADDYDTGQFLVFNKNSSTLKLSSQVLEKDIDTFIVDLKDKMDNKEPPMRIVNATKTVKHREGGVSLELSMQCAFCGFKKHCYTNLTAGKEFKGRCKYYDGAYMGPGSDAQKGNF